MGVLVPETLTPVPGPVHSSCRHSSRTPMKAGFGEVLQVSRRVHAVSRFA